MTGVPPSPGGVTRGDGRSTGATARRLAGVDGLRAVAALWVVLFHVHAFSGARLTAVPGLDTFARSGSTGVSLFLVLSGFCLYLPFAGGRATRFDARRFLVRRCRRLLPAYYVSLIATLLVLLVAGDALGLANPGLGGLAPQAGAHLALVHPWFPSTFYAVNGAYWSLGLEWQLYLSLPLLIIGVRRIGLARTAALAIACNVVYRLVLGLAVDHGSVTGTVATVVLPNQLPGRWGEFALGMVVAELHATGRITSSARRLAPLAAVLVPLALLLSGHPLSHLLFGTVFALLLVVVLEGGNAVSRVLSWRPLVQVGTMSYSLYLVHQPMVQAVTHVARGAGLTPDQTFAVTVLALPGVLAVAWVLFMTVERHTLSARPAGSAEDAEHRGTVTRAPAGATAAAAPLVGAAVTNLLSTAASPPARGLGDLPCRPLQPDRPARPVGRLQ